MPTEAESATEPVYRRYLPRVDRGIVYAPLIGLVGGIGAVAFHALVLAISHVVLAMGVGLPMEHADGEAPLFGHADTEFRPWLLLLVLPLGGLLSGAIVYLFAPEAEGHGTDAAIDAYHNKQGRVRLAVPLVKMVASALTLGTGGSGGQEGPVGQIGAGFGSVLATRLGLTDTNRRILMAAGLGAGIGSIFHAPLAGAIFAIEVLYRDPDFEHEALIPAFLATTIAYCVFGAVFGFSTLFVVEAPRFISPLLLLPLTVLALAMAAASLLYVKTFYLHHRIFARMTWLPMPLRPALGAAITALLAVAVYFATPHEHIRTHTLGILADGYGFLQNILQDPMVGTTPGIAVTLMLVVGLGKILATSLTIGSGGSGGLFAPSMVIGGSLGGAVGVTMHWIMPGLVEQADLPDFVILGMASFFAASAKTPVSTLLIVSEMTAGYTLLLPSMWVCALAYLVSRRWTLFHEQVKSRVDSPAHRKDYVIDVLEGMAVRDAFHEAARGFQVVPLDMPLKEMVKLVTATRQVSFPVVDGEGRYYGLFGLNDFREFLDNAEIAELAVAQDLATSCEPLTLQMNMSAAIGRFAESRFEELPVVAEDDPGKLIGLMRRHDMIAAYSAQLLALRSEEPVPPGPRAGMSGHARG